MRLLLTITRFCWFSIWYGVAAFVVLVAAVFGITRLLLPLVGEYNVEIEKQATAYLGRPIKIMSLDAEWHGFSPSLVLNNVRVLNNEGSKTLLQFSRARLDFSLFKSIKSRAVSFNRLALSGVDVSLVRQKTGQISLLGFEDNFSTDVNEEDNEFLAEWILGQGEIHLEAKNFLYHDEKSTDHGYHFTNVSLKIRNSHDRHLIDGVITAPGKVRQELDFSLDIVGDFISVNDWSGQFYVKSENLDFNQIVGTLDTHGLSVGIGPSSFELWGRWDRAMLSRLRGEVSLQEFTLNTNENFSPFLLQTKNLALNPPSNDNTRQASPKTIDKPIAKLTPESTPKDKVNVNYEQIIARFDWEKAGHGWRLSADQVVVGNNKRIWPSSQFRVAYSNDQENDQQNQDQQNNTLQHNAPQHNDKQANKTISVAASFIRLEDLLPVTPILFGRDNTHIENVVAAGLRGDLTQLNYRWNDAAKTVEVSSKFNALHLAAVESFPIIQGFSGEVAAVNDKGTLTLDTAKAVLGFPKVFREVFTVERLNAQFNWEIQPNNIVINSRDIALATKDIETKAILDLEIPIGKGAPFISLIANFKNGDASATSRYLPVSIMPESTVEWLDNAILQGQVTSGGTILYGHLDEFPFTQGQGIFETRFTVENGMLNYVENWPRLHDIKADVLFRGSALTIGSEQAKIFNNVIDGIHVGIDDLAATPLQLAISGQAHGSSQEKLNYLLVSPPLREKFENHLSGLKLYGKSDLALDIRLALDDDVTSSVTGLVEFHENRLDLTLTDALLTNINGKMKLLDHGVEASDITANLLGQPSVFNITTSSAKSLSRDGIRISAKGEFDAKALSKRYFPVLNDLVDGKSDWFVNLTLPGFQDKAKEAGSIRLSVESSLQGVALNLPPPFRKPADQPRQLKIRMDLKDFHNALLRTSYGGSFDGVFECSLDNGLQKGLQITRGETRFGIGPVALPKGEGVRVVGSMDELSLDIWLNLLSQIKTKKTSLGSNSASLLTGDTDRPFTSLLHSIDLFVGKFEAFGQQATNMSLKVENKQDWLAAKLDSKEIKGELKIPNDLKNDVVEMDLQHWHLTSSDASAGVLHPQDLPALSLNSRSVTYNNRKFGHVAIETAKSENGLLLQQIIIKPRETTLKGHGVWLEEAGNISASIEFVLESTDLGKTMKDLGFVGTIDEGEGVLNARLSWPGSLIDVDLEHLEGEVDFKLKNGRILELEPGGAARLFGLFSLQTLPRRLTLDFSDIFSKGLGFDLIEGQFRIEEGDAYTRNFSLQGPNANIDLKGRIGLATQDYDQKVVVIPHITDATILLSVITSQPILFFLQQLMKEDIEKATSLVYSLTGSWNNFTLEPILEKDADISEADEF